MTPESEIERLRAQVDTLTRERDEAIAERNDWHESRMRHKRWAEQAEARAESAEATIANRDTEIAAFQHAVATYQARITAALAACDLELSDGAPSTLNKAARHSAALAIRRALEPVGEPQPEPCATCGGTGTITVPDHSDECYRWQECVGDCPVAIPAQCPSCVPPETKP